MRDDVWVKINTTDGVQYLRVSVIDRLKKHVHGNKFDVLTWQGHLLCTVKGNPDAFLDDLFPLRTPANPIGFSSVNPRPNSP